MQGVLHMIELTGPLWQLLFPCQRHGHHKRLSGCTWLHPAAAQKLLVCRLRQVHPTTVAICACSVIRADWKQAVFLCVCLLVQGQGSAWQQDPGLIINNLQEGQKCILLGLDCVSGSHRFSFFVCPGLSPKHGWEQDALLCIGQGCQARVCCGACPGLFIGTP
jgi:hypothetical protein